MPTINKSHIHNSLNKLSHNIEIQNENKSTIPACTSLHLRLITVFANTSFLNLFQIISNLLIFLILKLKASTLSKKFKFLFVKTKNLSFYKQKWKLLYWLALFEKKSEHSCLLFRIG